MQEGAGIVVAGQTLLPRQATVESGHTISAASTGLVVDGKSVVAYSRLISSPASSRAEVVIGSQTFTIASASRAVILDGQTMLSGQDAIINGHTIALGPSSDILVDDSSTASRFVVTPATPSSLWSMSAISGVALSVASAAPLTVIEKTSGALVFHGITITSGQQTVVDGLTLSNPAGGVVVDGTAHLLSTLASSAAISTASALARTDRSSTPANAATPSRGQSATASATTTSSAA